MTNTVGETLAAVAAKLAMAGHPASDAEELLSRLLGVTRGGLRATAREPIAPGARELLELHVARRLAGEPVQYITGRAAFRSLDLAVDRRVLVPRPETEWLVEAVLEHLGHFRSARRGPRVLDLGTGSGCIALAIAAEHEAAHVTAVDASADALVVARSNAHEAGVAERVGFLQGDWFEALLGDARFDVIVSNPPYISQAEHDELPADVRDWEPHSALFSDDDGNADLRRIIEGAPRWLMAGGLLALELAETRAAAVASWLDGAHDWQDVELRDDLSGRPRILLARREKGPAIAPAQWGEED
jgi:release factor glutamine methyltransferase